MPRPIHIAYPTKPNRSKHAFYNGSGWLTETVFAEMWGTGLVVDNINGPHISYLDWPGTYQDHLKYVSRRQPADRDGGWRQLVGAYSSLKVDSSGQRTSATMTRAAPAQVRSPCRRVATAARGAWQCETVDDLTVWARPLPTRLGQSTSHHYYVHYAGDPGHAYHDGTAWQIETVDSTIRASALPGYRLQSPAMSATASMATGTCCMHTMTGQPGRSRR